MSLIIPPGFGQAVYVHTWTGDSEPMVVTMGHDLSDAGGDYQAAANHLALAYGGNVADRLSNAVTFTHVNLYVGQDGESTLVYESDTAPVSGTADGSSLPSNSAYLVRKRTGAAGRRGRGRLYLPGVGEDEVDNLGNLPGAWFTVLQDRLTEWYDALTVAGPGLILYPPVILHRSEGIGTEPPPTPITSFQLDGKIATQRQRLRR